MKQGRREKRREGTGILVVLVSVILASICAMGLAQALFSNRVIDGAQASSVGRRCTVLAESAVVELGWLIQREANTPGTALFGKLRQDVAANEIDAFDLPTIRLRNTEALLADTDHYDIVETYAGVALRRTIDLLPYEQQGVLRMEAAVASDLAGSRLRPLTRRVEVFCNYKLVKVTPPRPFDRYTVVVRNAGSMVGLGNEEIRACYRTMDAKTKPDGTMIKFLQDLIDIAKDLPKTGSIVRILKEQQNWERAAAMDKVMGLLYRTTADLEKGLPAEPEGPHLFGRKNFREVFSPEDLGFVTRSGTVDLAQLWIAPALRRHKKERTEAWTLRVVSLDRLKRLLGKKKPSVSAVGGELSVFCALRRREVKAAKASLRLFRDFQCRTRELTGLKQGSDLYRWEEAFFKPSLDPRTWLRKATYRVADQAEFEGLLDTIRPLTGIVWVDSSLNLTEQHAIAGKLVIVVRGNVRIEGTGLFDPSMDSLTVVAYGNAILSGQVQASVILARPNRKDSARLETSSDLVLHGNLIISGRLEVAGSSTMKGLTGAVVYNPTLDGGGYQSAGGSVPSKANHFCVVISPLLRVKGVYRQ